LPRLASPDAAGRKGNDASLDLHPLGVRAYPSLSGIRRVASKLLAASFISRSHALEQPERRDRADLLVMIISESVSASRAGSSIWWPTLASNKAVSNTRNIGRYNRRPIESCVAPQLQVRRRTDKVRVQAVRNRPFGFDALCWIRRTSPHGAPD
jgi:hypothetical protein